MKFQKLNLHHQNWISEPGPRYYSYIIRNKYFNIIFSNRGTIFGIKVNGQPEIELPQSGQNSNSIVEIHTTANNFDTHNYVQVTHTVKNKIHSTIKIDLGLGIDIQIIGKRV